MNIYQYKNYSEYVDAQVDANTVKIKSVWVTKSTIGNIHSKYPHATNILCHGVRNAKELTFFQEYYPAAHVIGTEIAPSAMDFANTIQHDFHEEKVEWLNKFDIVYSNSWDHSYDPHKSIETWKNQLNKDGKLIIEYFKQTARAWDPLDISHDEILILLEEHGLCLSSADTMSYRQKIGHLYITARK